jgi:hypothetical protein
VTYVDSAILNATEWLCRRFQLLTGRTNVWLAFQLTNLSIIVYFGWAAMYLWRYDGPGRIVMALFCSSVLYLLTQTIFKVPVETYETSAYQRLANGLRNPRRIRDVLLRIPFLTLSIVLFYPIVFIYLNLRIPIIVLVTYSLIVLTTIVLYLLACDPLPPCTGKVWEWLRRPAEAPLAASPSKTHSTVSNNLYGQISRVRRRTHAGVWRYGVRHPHDACAVDRRSGASSRL